MLTKEITTTNTLEVREDPQALIDRLIQRNNELLCVLGDCYDYFDSRADADCDQDGFIPNEEMKMLSRIKDLGL